jgi:signal transduction histidine kinase
MKRWALPITIAMLALVAAGDYASGVQISFVDLTYLVPIAFATWYGGKWMGVATALVAAASTTLIYASEDAPGLAPTVLNAIGALGMFLAFVWVLAKLYVHMEHERARLRGAIEQLRHAERLNVLGTLAAGVAHELGTPLNVISGAAEMLVEGEPSRPNAQKASRLILAQTDKITTIIRRLLEFSRRRVSTKSLVELDPAVSSAVDLLTATARKRGTTIQLTQGAGARQVRASAQEIEQVVSNLILNAIQAMPRGGDLVVSTRGEEVCEIIVEDHGVGIPPEDLPHIFDPFFTTKDVGEGTGLGLSVSYGIVTDLGGTIEVATEVGRGTRFVVRIPLAS